MKGINYDLPNYVNAPIIMVLYLSCKVHIPRSISKTFPSRTNLLFPQSERMSLAPTELRKET
jgi:hypothetical protein